MHAGRIRHRARREPADALPELRRLYFPRDPADIDRFIDNRSTDAWGLHGYVVILIFPRTLHDNSLSARHSAFKMPHLNELGVLDKLIVRHAPRAAFESSLRVEQMLLQLGKSRIGGSPQQSASDAARLGERASHERLLHLTTARSLLTWRLQRLRCSSWWGWWLAAYSRRLGHLMRARLAVSSTPTSWHNSP
jgi:hypothetical protein